MPDDTPQAQIQQAVAFFDAQNLFHSAKEAFGIMEPNFDPFLLAKHVCEQKNLELRQTRFYTGVPGKKEQEYWHKYWTSRLRTFRNLKIVVCDLPLRYRPKDVDLPTPGRGPQILQADGIPVTLPLLDGNGREIPKGSYLTTTTPEEKGIDVRLAIDFIRLTLDKAFDVGILFTQDQDHAETVKEAKRIAREQGRKLRIISVFPAGGNNPAGVNDTEWVKLSSAEYFACLDRPRAK